jgi:hypothetical protein
VAARNPPSAGGLLTQGRRDHKQHESPLGGTYVAYTTLSSKDINILDFYIKRLESEKSGCLKFQNIWVQHACLFHTLLTCSNSHYYIYAPIPCQPYALCQFAFTATLPVKYYHPHIIDAASDFTKVQCTTQVPDFLSSGAERHTRELVPELIHLHCVTVQCCFAEPMGQSICSNMQVGSIACVPCTKHLYASHA